MFDIEFLMGPSAFDAVVNIGNILPSFWNYCELHRRRPLPTGRALELRTARIGLASLGSPKP